MQPLISPVDHESRTNSYRAEDEPRTTEATPLLQRFPRNPGQVGNRRTTFIVGLLLFLLMSGVIIGIYLLVIQSRSENILPPIETPMRFVIRAQWDKITDVSTQSLLSPSLANQVIVVQTDTGQCSSVNTCSELLNTMRVNSTSNQYYNFLISSNGQTFEDLGWRWRSVLFPECGSHAIVLAFIGNFTEQAPALAQMQQADAFLEEAVSQLRLVPDFVIVGKRTQKFPKQLFIRYPSNRANCLSTCRCPLEAGSPGGRMRRSSQSRWYRCPRQPRWTSQQPIRVNAMEWRPALHFLIQCRSFHARNGKAASSVRNNA